MYTKEELGTKSLRKNKKYQEKLFDGVIYKFIGMQTMSESLYAEFQSLDKEKTLLVREDAVHSMEENND